MGESLPPFAVLFRRLRERINRSRYAISKFTGLDQSYLLRLERGDSVQPSRETVIKLALALVSDTSQVTLQDVNNLLLSAKHAPLLSRGESVSDVDPRHWTGS